MTKFLQRIHPHIWWIGTLIVLLPIIMIHPQHNAAVPVVAYYGTSTVWNVIARIAKLA